MGGCDVWAVAPTAALERLVAHAKTKVKAAKSQWPVGVGPATAFVASCGRIGWVVHNARMITTEAGLQLDLVLGPPAVVEKQRRAAVQLWRGRSIAATFGGEGGIPGCGDFHRADLAAP